MDIAKQVFEGFERTGEPNYSVLHPEVEWTTFGRGIEPKTYRGHRGAAAWMSQWGEAMYGRWALDTLDFEEVPSGKVLMLGRIRGQGKASGLDVDLRFWTVFEVRDGLVVRAQGFERKDHAMEAAAD